MNSRGTSKLKERQNNVNTCPDCGTQNQGLKFCKNCGKNLKEYSDQQFTDIDFIVKKDPGFAGVFSAIFPGLGQVYNEQLDKAVVLLIIGSISLFFLLGFSWNFLFNTPAHLQNVALFFTLICYIIYIIIWLIGINDAQKSARKINGINSGR